MITALFWFFVGYIIVGMVLNVLLIGRPRQPITPVEALVVIVTNLVLLLTMAELAKMAGVL